MVTVFAALVVPTVCAVNVRLEGVSVTGHTPVDAKANTCVVGPDFALSVIVTDPSMYPIWFGVAVTGTLQAFPAWRTVVPATHGLVPVPGRVKSPLAVKVKIVTALVLLLTMRNDFGPRLLPMTT